MNTEFENEIASWDADAAYEAWMDEAEPMDRPEAAFCDEYEVHESHAYRAVNGSTYRCPGMDQAGLDYCEALWNQPPCEHGMSQHLCAGPNHYPADR